MVANRSHIEYQHLLWMRIDAAFVLPFLTLTQPLKNFCFFKMKIHFGSQPIFRGKMLVSGGVCVDLFIGMAPPKKAGC